MSELVKLTAEGCAATFDPADGGRLTSFRIGEHEILVPTGKDMWHYGSFVMAPWVGRLRNATLNYQGKQYGFPANAGPHALHGLVLDRAWQVTGDGELSIELGDPWPWPCRVVQKTKLARGRADFTLEIHAKQPMPAALGWHPWFLRRLANTPAAAELQLDFEAAKMWANDEVSLPTGELTTEFPPQPWDYCFRELAHDPVVRWPGELELTVSSSCTDWIIYTMEEEGMCVEPWTAPPNSVNMPNPQIVRPGAPLVATMTWTWRTA